jgi:hypothetical protein
MSQATDCVTKPDIIGNRQVLGSQGQINWQRACIEIANHRFQTISQRFAPLRKRRSHQVPQQCGIHGLIFSVTVRN